MDIDTPTLSIRQRKVLIQEGGEEEDRGINQILYLLSL
jgi:hypothetical protein